MEMRYSEQDNSIRLIELSGELDITGTGMIETKFAGYCSGERPLIIIDLSKLEFLASIGIRLLTLTAKSVSSRGGKMVIVNPIPEVHGVLDITGIPAIIPIYPDLESAEAVLTA